MKPIGNITNHIEHPKLKKVYFEENGAIFNSDKTHRYLLWRTWKNEFPKLGLIGLNPSIADMEKDDQTVRRAIALSKYNNYGGIILANLFSIISTDVSNIVNISLNNLNTEDSNLYIEFIRDSRIDIAFIWGNNASDLCLIREYEVSVMFKNPLCFGINKNGSPKHILYLSNNTKLQSWH